MPTLIGTIPADFDGAKFRTRYGLAEIGDFWVDKGKLYLRDGLTVPLPAVFDLADPPLNYAPALALDRYDIDYTMPTSGQRVTHRSTLGHTLTMPDPKTVFGRQFVQFNQGPGPTIVAGGPFMTLGGAMVSTLGLAAGESLELLASFSDGLGGTEPAPLGFLTDGVQASPLVLGSYYYAILARYAAVPIPEMRRGRVTLGALAASAVATVTITFASALPSTSYSLVVTPEAAAGTGANTTGLTVQTLTRTTTGATVRVSNRGASATLAGQLHYVAILD